MLDIDLDHQFDSNDRNETDYNPLNMCVCVCVHTHTHIYIYVFIHICWTNLLNSFQVKSNVDIKFETKLTKLIQYAL